MEKPGMDRAAFAALPLGSFVSRNQLSGGGLAGKGVLSRQHRAPSMGGDDLADQMRPPFPRNLPAPGLEGFAEHGDDWLAFADCRPIQSIRLVQ